MNIFVITSVLMFFIMTVTGCGDFSKKNPVLATVGSYKITLADFNERISNLPARYREIVNKRTGEYLGELIHDTLLYQEALRKGKQQDKDVQKVIEEAKKKILIAKLLKDDIEDSIKISDEDIREFYRENASKYKTPELMRVSHILTPAKEDAVKVLEALEMGADFDGIARARSVDPTAQRGGDIGYFPKGQLMPEFEDACASLEIGEVSGVVKTKLGYHIIKLTDRIAPKDRPIEQVYELIKNEIYTSKKRKIFNELLEKLKKETKIEINDNVFASEDKPEEDKGKRPTDAGDKAPMEGDGEN